MYRLTGLFRHEPFLNSPGSIQPGSYNQLIQAMHSACTIAITTYLHLGWVKRSTLRKICSVLPGHGWVWTHDQYAYKASTLSTILGDGNHKIHSCRLAWNLLIIFNISMKLKAICQMINRKVYFDIILFRLSIQRINVFQLSSFTILSSHNTLSYGYF